MSSVRSSGGSSGREAEVPPGMSPDAVATWPPRELIDSFLGSFDTGLWPGETGSVSLDDPAAVAAAREFRDTLGRFCSGVTVVTSVAAGEPVGLTCQSFSSVSLDPPLVMFVPAKTSRAWPLIRRAGFFCVNFLAEDQQEVSNTFATRGADKFSGVGWTPSTTGAPILDGVVGHVDCTIHAVHEAGDHYVVLGRVQSLGLGADADPLLFYRGAYHRTDRPADR
jgi:3-hydroxy-9,10-secoandrosta-1,3,5(10)-triene-9,17-dione monooxygenase reductase component